MLIQQQEIYKKNFMGNSNFYYFTINKSISGNYYKIYLYSETSVSKVLGYYNEIKDILTVVFQGTTIKYFNLLNT